MKTNCYTISEEPRLVPCGYESALEANRTHGASIWIDLEDVGRGELEEKLDDLEVTGLARRLLLESGDRPGFFPLKDVTFLVLPVQADEEHFRDVEHVALLLRPNLLLTLRDKREGSIQAILSAHESDSWLPEGSVAGLVSSLLIAVSLESLRRTVELRNLILGIEARMDRDPYSVEIEEISRKRSELLTLESVVGGLLPILDAFVAADLAPRHSQSVRENLLCASSNLHTADRTLQWLVGRIDVLRSLVDANAQAQTNRRLGRLTILSMIFMPITLMAGIWGMNFGVMPELSLPFGYPAALGAMLVVGVGMYRYFRSRGWFD